MIIIDPSNFQSYISKAMNSAFPLALSPTVTVYSSPALVVLPAGPRNVGFDPQMKPWIVYHTVNKSVVGVRTLATRGGRALNLFKYYSFIQRGKYVLKASFKCFRM